MLLLSVNWGNAMIVTFLGFLIVCLLLIFLVGVVSVFGLILSKYNKASSKTIEIKNANITVENKAISGDYAAIAMALHLYFNLHDDESDIITIKNIDRRYSPWSSKIYNINNIG